MSAKGKLIFALIAVGGVMLRLGMPYLDETDTMHAEIEKISKENQQIKLDTQSYDSSWSKTMAEKEKKLSEALPETMNSGAVLEYFLNQFEKKHIGKIEFTSVNHQSAIATDIKVPGGKSKISPRLSRYKIKARVLQDTVVSYLEHLENYPGLITLENLSLSLQPKSTGPFLEMEAAIGLFLMPTEWTKPEKLSAEPPTLEGLSKQEEQTWFQIFSSNENSPDRKVSSTENPYENNPRFKIDQVVGNGIVVNERLYEEGDLIKGWRILKVDPVQNSVVFKKGDMTRKVIIP